MMLLEIFNELSLHPKNAAELKGLILQLAVQGKLTAKWREENPDVEPASELLKRIAYEKQKLIKAGKIKMGKTLPPIKDREIPFELPETWLWCRFQDVMINGFTGLERSKNFQSIDFQYPYFKMNNIGDYGNCNCENLTYVEASMDDVNKYSLKMNDFLFNTRNSYELVGKTCVIDFKLEKPILFNNNIFKVEFGCDVNSFFINLMFNSPTIKELLNSMKSATTNVAAIYQGKLLDLLIILAPIKEQHAIVTTVNQLFTEVEQLEQLTKERIQLKHNFATSSLQRLVQADNINGEWATVQQHFHTFFNEKPNVKKLRETILHLAVQGKLTTHWRKENPGMEPASELLKRIAAEKQQLIKAGKIKKEKPLPPIKEDEIPFELPDGWVWCRLGDVISLKSGQDLKPNEYSDTDVIGLPYITGASNLQNEKVIINRWTNAARSIAYKGELLIICKGSGVGKMGWLYEESVHIARQIMSVKSHSISLKYIKLILDVNVPRFKKNANGLIPGIDRATVLNTLISCPPLPEQHAIVATVNTLMGLCDALEQEIGQHKSQVEELMKSCLREVLVGSYSEGSGELGMAAEEDGGYGDEENKNTQL